MRAHLMLLIAVLGLPACAAETVAPTQVVASVDADPGVRTATKRLHLLVRGGQGGEDDWETRQDRELDVAGDDDWPLEISLRPKEADSTRVYELTVTALGADEVEIARVRALSGYVAHRVLALDLNFDDACAGKADECSDGQTCELGDCVDAEIRADRLPAYEGSSNSAQPDGGAAGGEGGPEDSGAGGSDAAPEAGGGAPDGGGDPDSGGGSDAAADGSGGGDGSAPDGDSGDPCAAEKTLHGPGTHYIVPPQGCSTLRATLWGGAGAAGATGAAYGGKGGAGGYARIEVDTGDASTIQLIVGEGGECPFDEPPAVTDYSGGAGSDERCVAGAEGQDGTRGPGGAGGVPTDGAAGGTGFLGGGGGGVGAPISWLNCTATITAPTPPGGGGGAATVLLVDGDLAAIAGGGGGGGAGSDPNYMAASGPGNDGGSGCGAAGAEGRAHGGGGGGGGTCEGDTVQQGTGAKPHDPDGDLPDGVAEGGDGTCAPGGGGYAMIRWAR